MSHVDLLIEKYTGEQLTESQQTDFEAVEKSIKGAKSENELKTAAKIADNYIKKYGNPTFLKAVKAFLTGQKADSAEDMLKSFQKMVDHQQSKIDKDDQWKAYQRLKFELG